MTADSTLLRISNTELLQANVRRHHRANRSGAHYGGKVPVLSLEDVQQRQQWAKNKQKEKDDKRKAGQIKRAEQDLIKTFREMCQFGPDLLGHTSTSSPTKSGQKSPQKASDSSQRTLISPFKRSLLPPPMLRPIREAEEIVEGVKEVELMKVVEGVKEVEVEEVKMVKITRRGRIVRPPSKM